MKAPFSTQCDSCQATGEQYDTTTLPCDLCGKDVCERCALEFDPDPPGRATCYDCASPIQKAQQAAQRARLAPDYLTCLRWTSTMRDWLLTAHHSPEGLLWDVPMLTACRWAVYDSMGADNAWEKGHVAIAHRLLDEVVKNLEQMRQQEVEVGAAL
jgi:hypothetical protein